MSNEQKTVLYSVFELVSSTIYSRQSSSLYWWLHHFFCYKSVKSVPLIFHISDFTELTSLSELIHFLKNLPILRNLSLLTPLLKMSKGNIWRLAQDPSYLVKIPLTQRAIAGLKSTIFLIWCLIFIQYPIMKWIFFNNPSMY